MTIPASPPSWRDAQRLVAAVVVAGVLVGLAARNAVTWIVSAVVRDDSCAERCELSASWLLGVIVGGAALFVLCALFVTIGVTLVIVSALRIRQVLRAGARPSALVLGLLGVGCAVLVPGLWFLIDDLVRYELLY